MHLILKVQIDLQIKIAKHQQGKPIHKIKEKYGYDLILRENNLFLILYNTLHFFSRNMLVSYL